MAIDVVIPFPSVCPLLTREERRLVRWERERLSVSGDMVREEMDEVEEEAGSVGVEGIPGRGVRQSWGLTPRSSTQIFCNAEHKGEEIDVTCTHAVTIPYVSRTSCHVK